MLRKEFAEGGLIDIRDLDDEGQDLIAPWYSDVAKAISLLLAKETLDKIDLFLIWQQIDQLATGEQVNADQHPAAKTCDSGGATPDSIYDYFNKLYSTELP